LAVASDDRYIIVGSVTGVRVDIPVYDGFDELDAIAPLEVFCNARELGADLHARLVVRQPVDLVTASHGLRLRPDAVFAPGADLVVVPGGGWAARRDVGTWGEVQRGDWLPLLAAAASDGATMASVCTGGMLLAHAGIVGSRRATTHHAAWADLEAAGATLVKERVVDDGDLVTSGGVTSGIDLSLWLVERFSSRDLADAVAASMEYERFRPAG
jgi:transcriptional regulator GlxA family with amidase domain